MEPLIDRIAVARYIAASHEGDIRIKELLWAITMRQDGGESGPIALEIACHFRSWQKSTERNKDRGTRTEGIATSAWIQSAINENLLTLSDPPRSGGSEVYSVGAIVTYVYDRDCMLAEAGGRVRR